MALLWFDKYPHSGEIEASSRMILLTKHSQTGVVESFLTRNGLDNEASAVRWASRYLQSAFTYYVAGVRIIGGECMLLGCGAHGAAKLSRRL